MGYAVCSDDLNKEDENKGLLLTGDLAKRDNDNFYYLMGRKKRFLKLFGNRINLDETESLLENIIPECACIGNDDHMTIYITDKARIDDVQHYLSLKTGINKEVFFVRHCIEIPKNSAGKILYSKLEI